MVWPYKLEIDIINVGRLLLVLYYVMWKVIKADAARRWCTEGWRGVCCKSFGRSIAWKISKFSYESGSFWKCCKSVVLCFDIFENFCVKLSKNVGSFFHHYYHMHRKNRSLQKNKSFCVQGFGAKQGQEYEADGATSFYLQQERNRSTEI